MNLLLNLVLRLYPKWWRERYGDEFNALLEDVRPGIVDTLNILKGALAMQLSTHGKNIRTIGLTTMIGIIAVLILGLTMEHQFESTALLLIQRQKADNTMLQDTPESSSRTPLHASESMTPLHKLQTIRQQLTNSEFLMQIADNHNLFSGLDSTKRLELMKKGIKIHVASNQNMQDTSISALSISFVYPDRTVVNKVINELTAKFINANIEQARLAADEGLIPKGASFKIIDPGRQPDSPIQPNMGQMLIIGLSGGIGLGYIILFFRRLTRRKKIS